MAELKIFAKHMGRLEKTHPGTHDHSRSSLLSREQPTSERNAVDSFEVDILVNYHVENPKIEGVCLQLDRNRRASVKGLEMKEEEEEEEEEEKMNQGEKKLPLGGIEKKETATIAQ